MNGALGENANGCSWPNPELPDHTDFLGCHRLTAVIGRVSRKVTILIRVRQTHAQYDLRRDRDTAECRVDDFIVAILTTLMRSTTSDAQASASALLPLDPMAAVGRNPALDAGVELVAVRDNLRHALDRDDLDLPVRPRGEARTPGQCRIPAYLANRDARTHSVRPGNRARARMHPLMPQAILDGARWIRTDANSYRRRSALA